MPTERRENGGRRRRKGKGWAGESGKIGGEKGGRQRRKKERQAQTRSRTASGQHMFHRSPAGIKFLPYRPQSSRKTSWPGQEPSRQKILLFFLICLDIPPCKCYIESTELVSANLQSPLPRVLCRWEGRLHGGSGQAFPHTPACNVSTGLCVSFLMFLTGQKRRPAEGRRFWLV